MQIAIFCDFLDCKGDIIMDLPETIFIVVIGFFVALFVLLALFYICREYFCWYCKINERRDLLFSINEKLAEISKKMNCESFNPYNSNSTVQNANNDIKFEQTNKVNNDSKQTEKTVSNNKDGYIITKNNGRTLAMRGVYPFCPKCHAPVHSETATECSNCGASFVE